jgi:hypothetical protein
MTDAQVADFSERLQVAMSGSGHRHQILPPGQETAAEPVITGTVIRKPAERMTATLACQMDGCAHGEAAGIPHVVGLLNQANHHAEQSGHRISVEVWVNPPEACA